MMCNSVCVHRWCIYLLLCIFISLLFTLLMCPFFSFFLYKNHLLECRNFPLESGKNFQFWFTSKNVLFSTKKQYNHFLILHVELIVICSSFSFGVSAMRNKCNNGANLQSDSHSFNIYLNDLGHISKGRLCSMTSTRSAFHPGVRQLSKHWFKVHVPAVIQSKPHS